KVIDEMIIKQNHGLVMTLGEIPKNFNNNRRRSPITRMGIAAFIRKKLSQAMYNNDDKNNDCAENNVLRKVLNQEMPIFLRAHRLDDIATAVRIKKEFGIKMVLVHGTEAYQEPELLKEHSIPIIAGPFYLAKSRK